MKWLVIILLLIPSTAIAEKSLSFHASGGYMLYARDFLFHGPAFNLAGQMTWGEEEETKFGFQLKISASPIGSRYSIEDDIINKSSTWGISAGFYNEINNFFIIPGIGFTVIDNYRGQNTDKKVIPELGLWLGYVIYLTEYVGINFSGDIGLSLTTLHIKVQPMIGFTIRI